MSTPQKMHWWQVWAVYLQPQALRMLFLGFSAGLPSVLVAGTLGQRLSEAQIDINEITMLSLVGLAYSFKWAWSPFVDKISIPLLTPCLGRRRSWMLLAQLGIFIGLVGMALTNVEQGLMAMVFFALLVAFSSATQDIALDAYRIESAEMKMQPALIAMYQVGFRFAMIWAGAGALWIAARVQKDNPGYDANAWEVAYLLMAASMLVGFIATLLSPEARHTFKTSPLSGLLSDASGKESILVRLRNWMLDAVISPFADFLLRYRKQAVIILSLIALYRISDIVMGVVANPFYNEMGYTKDQIAAVSKIFGLIMTLLGAFVGGMLVMRMGIFRILMLGAIASAGTNVLFSLLAIFINDLDVFNIAFSFLGMDVAVSGKVLALMAVISMDNLSGGIASAAFLGYLSSLTNIQFSATQYALFSSLMSLIPKTLGGFSGFFVKAFDYPTFFVATALLGIPVLFLVHLASRVYEYSPTVQVK